MSSASAGTAPTWKRPGLGSRLLAVVCYCGLAAVLLPFRRLRRDPFVGHHLTRGAVTFLYLLIVLVLALAAGGVLTYLLVHDPAFGHSPEEGIIFHFELFLAPPALLAGLLWLAGVLVALCGSTWDVALVGPLARRRFGVRLAVGANVLFLAGVGLLAGMTWHACSLARDAGAAPVYVLVDKRGAEEMIPHWTIKLASYRLALAATARWGPGSIVVAPLSERSLREAMAHGRLVMLWCHGSGGRFSMPDGIVAANPVLPSDAGRGRCLFLFRRQDGHLIVPEEDVPLGDDLQFVYCAACNAGEAAAAWEARVAPGRIVTFDRISGGLEHVLWLWFEAPGLVKEVR